MRRGREYALVLLFFVILTAAFTWPLALHPASSVMSDYGDPLLNTWLIAHGARSLAHPGSFWQGSIIYPARDVITYSEHLFSLVLPAAPVYLVSGNPLLAYNFLLFFGFVFSAFGAYLLLRYLTGNRWAGLAAGIFFAFCGYKFSQVGHLQICFSAYLPFTLFYLHKFLDGGKNRHLAAFFLFFLAQCLASWHYLIYAALAVVLVTAAKLLLERRSFGWGKLARLAAAGVLCVLLVIPFALPYARTHRRFDDFERNIDETLLYNARLGDFRTALPQNVLYGNGNRFIRLPGNEQAERVLFPGLGILLLALAALLPRRRRYRGWELEGAGEGGGPPPGEEEAAPEEESGSVPRGPTGTAALLAGYLALAACSLLLACGPEIAGHKNYFFVALFDLGLLKFIRVPARFFVPLSLSLAVLGGMGMDRLWCRVKAARAWGRLDARDLVSASFCLFLLLEMSVWKMPVLPVPVGGGIPEVYRWLSEQGDVRVIELPTEPLVSVWYYNGDYDLFPRDPLAYFSREGLLIYFNTVHWKKMVNGYSGYFPFSYNRTITEMQGFPAPRPLSLLEGLGVDYVIWHSDWVPEDRREYCERGFATLADRLELVRDFGDQQVWRVVRSGSSANPDDLRSVIDCPEALARGRGWQLGISVSDPTGLPFVSTDEEFHRLELLWEGEEGGTAFRQEATYHDPFFLEAGEEWTVTAGLDGTPPPGRWKLRVRAESGVLADRSWEAEVRVEEALPVAGEPEARLDAEFGDKEMLQGLMIDQVDGLFPVQLVVTNRGNALWPARSSGAGGAQAVEVSLRLRRREPVRDALFGLLAWGGGSGEEEQRCLLPCDVAPEQTVVLPLMLRLPREPGRYRLELDMTLKDGERFGETVRAELEVGEVRHEAYTP